MGVVTACKSKSIIFQKDIELIFVGQSNSFEFFMPVISMVCKPVDEVAESTLDLLMLELRNEIDQPIVRKLKAKYVVGDTCGQF